MGASLIIGSLMTIAMVMFAYRRFFKKELYDNKNFTYALVGILVIVGVYDLLAGLVSRDLFRLIFGSVWLFAGYMELQKAQLLKIGVPEKQKVPEKQEDATNGRKFSMRMPTNPANFAIGCVVGAMLFLHIHILIMIGAIIVLRVIAPKEQGAQNTKDDDKFAIFPIKPMLLVFGGMLATTMILSMLLSVPETQ